ncbi:cytochrome c biogenesis protein [Labilibacter marinus]|uniref:cytochrome c biogenesis protein n=1 Tax=Labilibacter marinus TaxID=1477105 RepID=UPI00094FA6E0|nr:cytochrome c biogenesis protein CcsA [Labilibacter marinus]
MKKILSFLAAPYLMGTLFLILAAAMGIATFVENDFGTNAAKALYYNSWWFEGVFVLLGINMFLNMNKAYMWKKGKLPVLLFHMSFFVIIVGAALTRYVGYEGMMHIREGATTDQFLSSKTYITGSGEKNGEVVEFKSDVLMSERSRDYFKKKIHVGDETVELKSVSFIKNTNLIPVEDENGEPMLSLVVSAGGGRNNLSMFPGEDFKIGDITIGFSSEKDCDFNIFPKDDQLYFTSKFNVFITDMGTQERTDVDLSEAQPFYSNVLYGTGSFFMVQTNYMEKAILKAVPAKEGEQGTGMEAIVVNAKAGEEEKTITLQGRGDRIGEYKSVQVGGVKLKLNYGSIVLTTPFDIKLNDFQLERYPGSDSPSSFASEVTLKDSRNGVNKDFRIFMNNILYYQGYRFYQSSYDTDERGTVLSVNNDLWGTIITYIGYFLMTLSMILSLVASKSRFRHLGTVVSEIGNRKKALVLAGILSVAGVSQAQDIDAYINVTEQQAKVFGELWAQDNGGRFKPMNSVNGEILRKLVKHNSFKGYSADRVVLSILSNTEAWKSVPLITVDEEPIQAIVGNTDKKASFSDFFGSTGNYKLKKQVEEAYRTKPAYRSKFQNEVVKIDEQVNVFYLVHTGQLLKLFPIPGDEYATWLTPGNPSPALSPDDSMFVRNIFPVYLQALKEGKKEDAATYVDAIAKYQNKFGENVLPTEKDRNFEIFYNKTNVFLLIAPVFFILGLILLIVQFVYLFLPRKTPKFFNVGGAALMILLFLVYTAGMITRWYISGHAPWTDGYESMLLIGWALVLAGLIFSKRTPIVLSIAGIFTGIVLMVAHLGWMNPEITNLVPVLKSYWLNIHVAVIVISYGFLGLGAFMGFFNLIIIGLKKEANEEKIDLTITELSSIMEMMLTVGLYLLTIGAFLGGVWANESWGRYWGWDPKETWSLVTVMIYAFILHMRFIPGLKGQLSFNIVSVVGFFSVVMTYLGVNYYLAGMHSYAKGDPVPVPIFVYYVVVTVLVVAAYAGYNAIRLKISER